MFTVENPLCGGLTLTVSVDEASYPIRYENGVFEVSTNDLNLRGTDVSIGIEATLDDYPTSAFRSPTGVYE